MSSNGLTSQPAADTDLETLTALTNLVERAASGDINGIAYVVISNNNYEMYSTDSVDRKIECVLTAIELLKVRLISHLVLQL